MSEEEKKDLRSKRDSDDKYYKDSEEEYELVWYNYLVSYENEGYATIMSFDETYSSLWIVDSFGAKCELVTDFKTDDKT